MTKIVQTKAPAKSRYSRNENRHAPPQPDEHGVVSLEDAVRYFIRTYAHRIVKQQNALLKLMDDDKKDLDALIGVLRTHAKQSHQWSKVLDGLASGLSTVVTRGGQ